MSAIRERIAARQLTPGARLPSVRQAAAQMAVSVSTVVEAYERLAAEGLIRSRPGSGFYVSAPLAPLTLEKVGPRLDRAVDPLWVSRQSLEARDGSLRPGCGWLPPDWMPEAALRRALKAAARLPAAALMDYDEPQGLAPLRALIARRLGEKGVPAAPERVLLTGSGTQAIDLVCRMLLRPGDRVLIDDPCYFNFQALLRAHGAEAVGVPMTPEGPDSAAFARIAGQAQPRLYIANSAVHNPTGARLAAHVAHRLLSVAEASGMAIVEDDIFSDFETRPGVRLAGFDGLRQVIAVGSYSKTLSASVRLGFVAARAEWIERLVDLSLATAFGSPRLASELVLALLRDGSYRRHVAALRDRLAEARTRVAARLQALGIVPWIMPEAGVFLWCRLPDGLDAEDVARRCLGDGVVLAPGNAFSLSQGAQAFLRFNVAQSLDPRLYSVLEQAMAAARAARVASNDKTNIISVAAAPASA